MNTDNIDRFGHCVVCHKNLIVKRVVDNQVIDMFLPIHDHTDLLLDNGSLMKVCICKPCKSTTDFNSSVVKKNIMDAVNKGWELEVKILVDDENFPEWTKESGNEYLNKMKKLKIDCSAETMNKLAIESRRNEIAKNINRNVDSEKLEVV